MAFFDFLFGSKSKQKQVSNLSKEQQPLLQQLIAALQGEGAGGAYGTTADYYRSLLDPNSQAAQAFSEPEMRRFREETIPGLAEQFAGMGSGALSSSGFRNAGVAAGTDLQERLAAIRAGLQMQGAQGLQGLSQMGLNPQYQSNLYYQGQPGFLQNFASGAGQGFGKFIGGGGNPLSFLQTSKGG